MKKVFPGFASGLAVSAFILFQSCNTKELISENVTTDEQELAFEQFKADLKSLNYDLGYPELMETKGGWGEDFTRDVADAVGGALGTRFGGTIGISIGTAFGGFGGLAGYVVGHKYGGLIGTVLFSTAAGAIYDLCSGCSITINQLPGSNTTICPSDESLSLGEVHNLLLSSIRSNGKQYILEGGTIAIDELYNDILSYAEEMNIEDVLSRNEGYIAYIKDCCNKIADITFQDAKGTLCDSYKNTMKEFCEDKGLSSIEAQNVMDVISITEVAAVLDEPQAIEYEKRFEELVDNSNLSLNNKAIIKTAGSISIMSNNYWYAKK